MFVKSRIKQHKLSHTYSVKTQRALRQLTWKELCIVLKEKFKISRNNFCLQYITSYGEEIIIDSELMFEKAVHEMRKIKGKDISVKIKLLSGPGREMKHKRSFYRRRNLKILRFLKKIPTNNEMNESIESDIKEEETDKIPNHELEAKYSMIIELYEKEKISIMNEKGITDVKYISEKDFSEVSLFTYKKIFLIDLFPVKYNPNTVEDKYRKYFEIYENYDYRKRDELIKEKVEIDSFKAWYTNSRDNFYIYLREKNLPKISLTIHQMKTVRMRFVIKVSLLKRVSKKKVYKNLTKNFVFSKAGFNVNWGLEEGSLKLTNLYKFAIDNLSRINHCPISLSDF